MSLGATPLLQEMAPYAYSSSNTEDTTLDNQVWWNTSQYNQTFILGHPMQQQMTTTTSKYTFCVNVSLSLDIMYGDMLSPCDT